MKKILFVCLGNICRSPMAEAIFQNLIEKKGLSGELSCDSAGTARYHVGAKPDYRTIKVLGDHNIKTNHIVRQFKEQDYDEFDLIIAMDKSNFHDILVLARNEADKQTVKLMRDYDEVRSADDNQVPDPYYGEISDFTHVYQMLDRCCKRLIEDVK